MTSDDLTRQRPFSCLRASLHHLVLASPAPEMLAAFYGEALGYQVCALEHGYLAQAPGRMLGIMDGPAKTLVEAGYAVEDGAEMDRLCMRLEQANVAWEVVSSPIFDDAIRVVDPDGNPWSFGRPKSALQTRSGGSGPAARLQHVVMASQAPERLVSFFTAALGFTLSDDVVDEENQVRTSFLRCSHEHHSFAVFKGAENRLDHHCYETADWNAIRDWSDRMAERHIPIRWGPGRHGPGNNLFVFVHDPDGNWVELSAELEVVRHDRPVGRWPHAERTLNSWGQGRLRS